MMLEKNEDYRRIIRERRDCIKTRQQRACVKGKSQAGRRLPELLKG